MKILGINLSHNFSTCVYEEGKIKDVWLEERFNNFKNWRIDSKKNLNTI